MQLSRINFGHAVRIGQRTLQSVDLEGQEFKNFKAELIPQLQAIKITYQEGKSVLVPLGNVASCEIKPDVIGSESTETPDRTGQERKGKVRTT
jgi:hypothetical protein